MPRNSGRTQRGWSFSAGNYGAKVRVFTRSDRRGIWIKFRNRSTGKEEQHSLGHEDRVQAKQECRELAQSLEAAAPAESAKPFAEPDLEGLLALYENEQTPHKRPSQQSEDQRRRKIWSYFFAISRVSRPEQLDDSHLQQFIRLRQHGDLQVPEVALREPAPAAKEGENRPVVVEPRTIDADLVYLNRVFNWAMKRKVDGRLLLAAKPVHIPRLRSKQVKRPIATWDDVRALLRWADAVDPQQLFGCFLRLLDSLGWRVTATCRIRASDIDLAPGDFHPYGTIRKNRWVDKEGVGDWVPLSRHLRATLKRLLRRRGLAPGDNGYLFPAVRSPARAWNRWRVRDLMLAAEKEAKISHIGGPHSFRRKWFSERKDHPLPDLMKAGGHADPRMVQLYQQADPETTYRVVSQPTRRVRRTSRTAKA